jgi:O-antigen ligase
MYNRTFDAAVSEPKRVPRPVSPSWFGRRSAAATGVFLYTLLLISRLPELVPGVQAIRPILLLALVVMGLAALLPTSRIARVLQAPETRAVFGMAVLAAASVPGGLWPGQSFSLLVFAFSKTVIFFLLILYCIRSQSEFRRFVWAPVAALGCLELAAFLAKAQGRIWITGTYDPNDLAFMVVSILPIAIALFPVARGTVRFILSGVIGLAFLTIIMTQSRGGFVSLLVVGALILAKVRSRVPLLRTGMVAAAILVFTLFAPASYWERMATIWGGGQGTVDTYARGGFSTARWEMWKTGIGIMAEHPFLGVGMGNFPIAEGATHKHGQWWGAHNSFIQIGAELGIGGLALYVYLLYRTIRNCRTVNRRTRRDRSLQYQLAMAQGTEIAVYGYIVGVVGLNQAYSDILYLLVALSVLLKWLALSPRSESPRQGATTTVVATAPLWWRRTTR